MNFGEIYSQPSPAQRERVRVGGNYNARIRGISYTTIPVDEPDRDSIQAILISYDIEGNRAYYQRIKFDTTDTKKIKFRLEMLVNLLISLGKENVQAAIKKASSVIELADLLSELYQNSPNKNNKFVLYLHNNEFNGRTTVGINVIKPPYIGLEPITYGANVQ